LDFKTGTLVFDALASRESYFDKENNFEERYNIFYYKKAMKNQFIMYYDFLLSIDEYNKLRKDEFIEKVFFKTIKDISFNNIIKIYSDGASFNNGFKNPDKPMYGSFGTIVMENDKELKIISEAYENFTNNQGEISGVLKGLKFIDDNFDIFENDLILVFSDSQYVINGSSNWIHNWEKNHWKNNTNKIIENLELWKDLYKYILKYKNNMKFHWLRGHQSTKTNDYIMNNRCDDLATKILKAKLLEDSIN